VSQVVAFVVESEHEMSTLYTPEVITHYDKIIINNNKIMNLLQFYWQVFKLVSQFTFLQILYNHNNEQKVYNNVTHNFIIAETCRSY